jgi:hypothetical protein
MDRTYSWVDTDGDVLEVDHIGNKALFEIVYGKTGIVELDKNKLGEVIETLNEIYGRLT